MPVGRAAGRGLLSVYTGESDRMLDEIHEFLTGVRAAPPTDRELSTVLFTDERARTSPPTSATGGGSNSRPSTTSSRCGTCARSMDWRSSRRAAASSRPSTGPDRRRSPSGSQTAPRRDLTLHRLDPAADRDRLDRRLGVVEDGYEAVADEVDQGAPAGSDLGPTLPERRHQHRGRHEVVRHQPAEADDVPVECGLDDGLSGVRHRPR